MKRLLLQKTLAPLALLCSCSLAFASPMSEERWQPAIKESRTIIETFMEETHYPGLSISIGYENEIIWSQGFGYADLEAKKEVDPAVSKFRIGSVSKPITAFAVGLLVQESKLDLDAPVQTYVPDFPKKNWPITTRQAAGHLAGIRHYQGSEFMSAKYFPTVSEGLSIFQESPLMHEPGTKFSYSSYSWNLVSAVIEGASDTEFLEFMDTQVFSPLGMTQTMAEDARADIEDRVAFYGMKQGKPVLAPYVDNSYKWAGGGFLSTTNDVITFALAHLDSGLLQKETVDLLWTSMKTKDGEKTKYGIGWKTSRNRRGEQMVGHGGGSIGGTTHFRIYPEKRLAIAMAINVGSARIQGVPGRIERLFIQTLEKSDSGN